MSKPRRIQRKRTKGWRMPEGAVYVGRPTRWGNPHRVGDWEPYGAPLLPRGAMEQYRDRLEDGDLPVGVEDVRDHLAGRDLVCWCPLDQPCHADVLLEIANEDQSR